MMLPPAADIVVIFAVVMAWLLVGAGILQGACALYNRLAGLGADSTQETADDDEQPTAAAAHVGAPAATPDDNAATPVQLGFGPAAGIVFGTAVASLILGFLVAKVAHGAGLTTETRIWVFSPITYLVTIPVSLVVIAGILPTRFSKGLVIAFLYLLIWLVIGVVIAAIVLAAALVFAVSYP